MDATCAIQNSIHVFSLVHINMCPGFWVHINSGKAFFYFIYTIKRGCEITASTEKEDFSFKMNERSSFMLKLTCDENFNYKL